MNAWNAYVGKKLRSFTLRNFIEDALYTNPETPEVPLRSFTLRNFIEEGGKLSATYWKTR